MATEEARITALENDRRTARREHVALARLTTSSFEGVHNEIDALEVRLRADMERGFAAVHIDIASLKDDMGAVLKILRDHLGKALRISWRARLAATASPTAHAACCDGFAYRT